MLPTKEPIKGLIFADDFIIPEVSENTNRLFVYPMESKCYTDIGKARNIDKVKENYKDASNEDVVLPARFCTAVSGFQVGINSINVANYISMTITDLYRSIMTDFFYNSIGVPSKIGLLSYEDFIDSPFEIANLINPGLNICENILDDYGTNLNKIDNTEIVYNMIHVIFDQAADLIISYLTSLANANIDKYLYRTIDSVYGPEFYTKYRDSLISMFPNNEFLEPNIEGINIDFVTARGFVLNFFRDLLYKSMEKLRTGINNVMFNATDLFISLSINTWFNHKTYSLENYRKNLGLIQQNEEE